MVASFSPPSRIHAPLTPASSKAPVFGVQSFSPLSRIHAPLTGRWFYKAGYKPAEFQSPVEDSCPTDL